MSKYDTISLLVLNSFRLWHQQFIHLNLASRISRERIEEKWCSCVVVMAILLICLRERGIYDIEKRLWMEGLVKIDFFCFWGSALLRRAMNFREYFKVMLLC